MVIAAATNDNKKKDQLTKIAQGTLRGVLFPKFYLITIYCVVYLRLALSASNSLVITFSHFCLLVVVEIACSGIMVNTLTVIAFRIRHFTTYATKSKTQTVWLIHNTIQQFNKRLTFSIIGLSFLTAVRI
jgi:small-conductance mechanosensitive channel